MDHHKIGWTERPLSDITMPQLYICHMNVIPSGIATKIYRTIVKIIGVNFKFI